MTNNGLLYFLKEFILLQNVEWRQENDGSWSYRINDKVCIGFVDEKECIFNLLAQMEFGE